jgi:TRAP-type C4-dicarboxylate transport system substrate-binding protein
MGTIAVDLQVIWEMSVETTLGEAIMRRLLVLTALVAVFGAANSFAAPKLVRIAGFTPEKSVVVTHTMKPFIKAVNAEVGDEVRLKGYWGGALGRNPKKQYDLVLSGVTDTAILVPGYSPGKFPDFGLFELPFLARTGLEASIAMWRMFKQGHIRGFDKVKLLGVYSTDVFFINTKEPIKTFYKLNGLKIRTAGPVLSDTVKALGGVPVGLPTTQTTESLSRGVIDGVLTGWSGILVFRMASLLKYHYEAPLGIVPLVTAMNKKTWDSLSPRVQASIDKHSGEVFAKKSGGGFDRVAGIMASKARKGGGHTIIKLDAEGYKRGAAWAKPLHEKWIKSTPNGRKKYDAYLKVLTDIRAGK